MFSLLSAPNRRVGVDVIYVGHIPAIGGKILRLVEDPRPTDSASWRLFSEGAIKLIERSPG